MGHDLIPIIMFLCILAGIGLYLYFNYKNRAQVQDTVQKALDHGNALSPELLDAITPKTPKETDLRRGVLLIAFGIAFFVVGYMFDDAEAMEVASIGFFPLMVGLGYLVVWKLAPGDRR